MRISIFGLGYVGAVSAGCFCKLGHRVIGVDPVEAKRDKIIKGESPVIEADLDALIAAAVSEGQLSATDDVEAAIHGSDVSMVCVGTPSRRDGSLNLDYVRKVCGEIGAALATRQDGYHVVVVRSTMLPGAAEETAIPAIEQASGLKAGRDFGFCVNPEFLRESTAVRDFFEPPKTVIGALDERSGAPLQELYRDLDAPLFVTEIPVAAMIKYTDNVFHALKVVFGNEIGAMCRALDIDSHKVMEIVCKDEKLNISPAYLMPGFAFGGSCLPKDLRALLDRARTEAVGVPMLSALLPSNELHVRRFVDEVVACGRRKVAVLGLAFKAGTDDLRESPIVSVVETLIGKGFDITIFDRNVSLAAIIGANRAYILNEIPHISSLLSEDLETAVDEAEVVIVANRDDEFARVLRERGGDKVVFDLARQFSPEAPVGAEYYGICW